MKTTLRKYILIFSAIFAFTFVSLANELPTLSQEDYEHILVNIPETPPEFPGGINGLMRFLSENIRYPAEAQKSGIQGSVVLQFVVNTDGSIVDIQVVRSVDPSLDREAIRVVELMPNWTPGEQRGKKVRVRYTLPINFRLSEE